MIRRSPFLRTAHSFSSIASASSEVESVLMLQTMGMPSGVVIGGARCDKTGVVTVYVRRYLVGARYKRMRIHVGVRVLNV